MAKMPTKKSEFFVVGDTVEKLSGVTGIDPGNVSATTIDLQDWDNDVPQPVQTGFDIAAATVSVVTDPENTLHQRLHSLAQEVDSDSKHMRFVLGWSDGTAAPTVDADGNLKLPPGRTFYQFDGWVSSFPMDFTGDSVQTEMTIQRTTKGTWSTKSEAA